MFGSAKQSLTASSLQTGSMHPLLSHDRKQQLYNLVILWTRFRFHFNTHFYEKICFLCAWYDNSVKFDIDLILVTNNFKVVPVETQHYFHMCTY